MSMVRCKVICTAVEKYSAAGYHTEPKVDFMYRAKFIAVYGGSEENKKFFASTPTLTLEVSAVNGDQFAPGQEYYLDFTEVQK